MKLFRAKKAFKSECDSCISKGQLFLVETELDLPLNLNMIFDECFEEYLLIARMVKNIEVPKELVKELRLLSGAMPKDCKLALQETNLDIDKAARLLRGY